MVGQVGSNIWSSATTALTTVDPSIANISATKARAGQAPADKTPPSAQDPASAPSQLSPDLQAWMTGQQGSSGGDAGGADLAQRAMQAYAGVG